MTFNQNSEKEDLRQNIPVKDRRAKTASLRIESCLGTISTERWPISLEKRKEEE